MAHGRDFRQTNTNRSVLHKEIKKRYRNIGNLKCSNYHHLWSHPKNRELRIFLYILMIHTVNNTEGGGRDFIHILHRNCKKIKTICTVLAKQDTIVLQVLMCSWHLWPQSKVSPSALPQRSKILTRGREREREREGVHALEILLSHPHPPPRPPRH